ncbi:MAG: hypothetical protein OXU73_00850 [Candidatus Campbellbacteria bacterium]|nr:hypothetical protein [Candidatus Campbellbacteria bacterium]
MSLTKNQKEETNKFQGMKALLTLAILATIFTIHIGFSYADAQSAREFVLDLSNTNGIQFFEESGTPNDGVVTPEYLKNTGIRVSLCSRFSEDPEKRLGYFIGLDPHGGRYYVSQNHRDTSRTDCPSGYTAYSFTQRISNVTEGPNKMYVAQFSLASGSRFPQRMLTPEYSLTIAQETEQTPAPTITAIAVSETRFSCVTGNFFYYTPWSDDCPRITDGGSTSNSEIVFILGCRPSRATGGLDVYVNGTKVRTGGLRNVSNKNSRANEYACPTATSVSGSAVDYHITTLEKIYSPGEYKIEVAEPGSSQKSNAVTITIDKTTPTITGTVPTIEGNLLPVPITVTDNVGVRTTASWFLHTRSTCPTTESSYTNTFTLGGTVKNRTGTIRVIKQKSATHLCVRAEDTAGNTSHRYIGHIPKGFNATTTPITGLDRPQGIAISGNHAYVFNRNNTLSIINISNATSPTVVSSPSITGLNRPYGIAIKGNYAYVVNRKGNTLSILNLSNATSPTVVGNPISITGFSNPQGIAIKGNYAYVVNRSGNTLSIINISNATSPTAVSSPSITGFNSPYGIAIKGNYAYVTNINNTLSILNLSNAISPTVVGNPISITGFERPQGIAIAGDYAYVVNRSGNTLSILNLSNATSPTVVGNPISITGFSNPQGIAIKGGYAYVTNTTNTISIINVSTNTTPPDTTPTITAIGVCPGETGSVAPWSSDCPRYTDGQQANKLSSINGRRINYNRIVYIFGCRPNGSETTTGNLDIYINDVKVRTEGDRTDITNINPTATTEKACDGVGSVTGRGNGYHITYPSDWNTEKTPGTYKIQVAEPGSSQKSNAVTITIINRTLP